MGGKSKNPGENCIIYRNLEKLPEKQKHTKKTQILQTMKATS